jgi:Leucine-rich repeat (LRR) protein
MNKTKVFLGFVLVGLLVVLAASIPLQAAIPAEERAALIALYNATNGDNWENNSRWKGINPEADGFSENGSEGTWFGITVSGDHVIEISLYYNNLNGSLPPELGSLSNLESLYLADIQLSGIIPSQLGNLSSLEVLYLSSDQLSGSIPSGLGNLGNLRSLYLYGSQLSGSIPFELGNLNNLEELYLTYTRLSGSIPPELGNLSNLKYFYLSDSQLTGSIPSELGNLGNLEVLYLGYNQLSGSIPPELGNLANLKEMDLSSNRLSGSIPPELGNLSNLNYLVLESNQLTGNIPTSLINLSNLWWIDIRYNCLYTNEPDLRAWLNNLDPDWESYQCSGPGNPPFGSFETPIDGSSVCSSIPVTGWALDDTGIDSVKIYREQGNQLVYIGDAVLVEGARPDVVEAYPDYPYNTKAGWGYMMLTNFLPNSGNGTFVIHAIATDFVGKTTTLGTKTIYCDNANAVKPFGAIDTPTQGGSASGSSFINWGWVLTPQPNYIPKDGSTINVYVDGVSLGHPIYNIYRSDIANLFPDCINSNGAAGYFYLDTTAYENGVHTIQWTARDSGGNTDGIGSRYFSISNTGTSTSSEQSYQENVRPQTPMLNVSKLLDIPVDCSVPVRVKRGFKEDIEPQVILADETGMNRIDIKEVERVQIYLTEHCDDNPTAGSLSSNSFTGYLEVNDRLEPLPVGSTLDTQKGIFYWQPGPGFIGEYRFVFIEKEKNTNINRKNVIVKIVPRFQ